MGIAKILANHPNFKDKFNRGFYAVGVMTGGGFGSVDINVLNDNKVMIRTSESGHNLAFDPIEKKVLRLGKLGASAKCVIENYSEALGIKDENKLKALINTGDARIATNEEITLKTDKDAIAIETLLETGVYKVKEKLDGKTVLQVDSSDPENIQKFKNAQRSAINEYVDAIAQHAITKINEGADLMILTGPLALGLNKTVANDPENFNGRDSLRDLIMDKIDSYVKNDITCTILREEHGFDILCTDEINLPDNTVAGPILLDDKTSMFARRGEWITISTDALKE